MRVNDGVHDTDQAITVTVADGNDNAPAVAVNTGLTLAEGASATTITQAMLRTTDADNTPSELVYTLSAVGANGVLALNAVALAIGNTFTQADIDSGLLSYSHDGSETAGDAFSFTVSDGSAGTASTSFTITVNPVNDQTPAFTSPSSFNVAENTTAVATLTASDADLPANTLSYSIAGGDDAALFSIDASTGALRFIAAPDFEAPADVGSDNVYDLTVRVNDGVHDTDQAITVTVDATNEPPAGSDATLSTPEDTALVLTAAHFGFSDPGDTPANSLTAVRISTLPLAGLLRLNGAAVTTGQSVSVADINAALLVFTPAADANGSAYASFTFQVQDNGGTANGGVDLDPSPNTLTINVSPVNDAPTGAVTIDNAAPKVNQTLNLGSTLADVDGMPNPVGYQWQSSADGTAWSDIDSANASSFTVGAAQQGLQLRVRASFIDGGGTLEIVDSIPTAAVTSGTIDGTAGPDNLLGTGANDWLNGLGGNDTLDGAAGADTMVGGPGDDLYIVDDAGDVTTEQPNEGTDRVNSSISWTLGANIENLTLTGGAAIDGSGNSLANSITGNAAANVLDGGTGNDTLVGGAGDDTYVVDSTGDVITELAGQGNDLVRSSVSWTLGANIENLTLTGAAAINGTGNTLNNTLTGNGANNVLDGGTGADTMIGGAGDDSYVVDNSADVITELLGAGTDIALSSVTWILAANVENLTLTGSSAINGPGNDLANVITGNGAANWLSGWGGDDWLIGGGGNDTLNGGEGNDTLDGGLGNDSMAGTNGDDTYIVDSTGDVITEGTGQGVDQVMSSVTWTLGNNFENLTLTGNSAINGTGNSLNNTLVGNAANNTLRGNGGVDTMTGGLGADTFDFDATADSGVGLGLRDIITDFVSGEDKLDFSTIDANTGVSGNQAFSFIGNAAFTAAAQVRYVFDGTNTIVQGNIGGGNGNVVDFEVQLQGNVPFLATDLIP